MMLLLDFHGSLWLCLDLMVGGGMEWDGVGFFNVPSFGYINEGWDGMGKSEIDTIPSHSIQSFLNPLNLGGLQWEQEITRTMEWYFVPIPLRSIPLCSAL